MLSVPHMIVIFLVTLVVLGPDKLPQVARVLGKAMADFRRITGDFRYQMESEMREMERQVHLKELSGTIAKTGDSSSPEGLPEVPVAEPVLPPYESAEQSAYEAAHTLSLGEHPASLEEHEAGGEHGAEPTLLKSMPLESMPPESMAPGSAPPEAALPEPAKPKEELPVEHQKSADGQSRTH